MKIKSITLKCLVFFVFVALVSSCTTDEYEYTEGYIEMEVDILPDTLVINKRTRVDDKDGD